MKEEAKTKLICVVYEWIKSVYACTVAVRDDVAS